LLHQAKAIAPVHVIGLTPVDEAAMPYAGVLWYRLDDIRRYEGLLRRPAWKRMCLSCPCWRGCWQTPTGPSG